MNSLERTLSIVKPDAVERNLTENIKKVFTENKLKIVQEKKIQISKEEAAEFYKVHQTKPFYERLCNYLCSGPITVIILEGDDALKANRIIMGATDPKNGLSILQLISLYDNELILNEWTYIECNKDKITSHR